VTLSTATDARFVGDVLRSAVERHADRDALVDGARRWSYRDLARLVSAGSEILRPMVEGRRRRIAIIGGNHPAYVIAYFSAQLIGASSVEIGADEAHHAISRVLELADPAAIITDRTDLISAAAPRALDFNTFLRACECSAAVSIDSGAYSTAAALDEASIVFTSGTTGVPKGVILSHANILFVVNAVRDYLALTPQDRYAISLPLSHTYGKSTLLSAIAAGAASVLVRNFQDFSAFFDCVASERCTVLSVVPFHLNVIARRGLPADCDLHSLRAITCSGGPLAWETFESVERLLPGARLVAMYGLTESSTRVTYLPPAHAAAKRGSVGRPLDGVRLEIRDEQGQAVPSGAVGRLYVRGPNVMQGYLGDPELTAQTIVDGWLDTGDLGHVDEDGYLFITGRDKDIIKVAGERISAAEIDHVVMSHPDVVDAAVIGVPDPLLGETVVAYVVFRPGAANGAELPAYCAARLSHHKVPRRFISIPCIPRTSTGKVRRHVLREAYSGE
jgi:acyl-CoA synthetase (AMP-forming)/AMP-acid ligase II